MSSAAFQGNTSAARFEYLEFEISFPKFLHLFQGGKIPLLLAVEAGNQSMCRELLSVLPAEQLKSVTDMGDTALHIAARRRDLDLVKILVDYGANVDSQNVSLSITDSLAAPLKPR